MRRRLDVTPQPARHRRRPQIGTTVGNVTRAERSVADIGFTTDLMRLAAGAVSKIRIAAIRAGPSDELLQRAARSQLVE
jgi:hypothetical protein